MKKVILFSAMTLIMSSASADDLMKALGAALNEAEANHSAKQVALEVDADKIEKAKFRKNQDPTVLEGATSAIAIDTSSFSTVDMADEEEVEDSVEIAKELSDN